MKLLFYDMGAYTGRDLEQALADMGIACRSVLYKLKNVNEDAYFTKRIDERIDAEGCDAVLSVNYFPVLARLCARRGLPYLAWCYDSPLAVPDIEQTIGLETNRVFFFDRAECRKYQKRGFAHIYHLPLAADPGRLLAGTLTEADRRRYGAEVSMVGQLYETMLPLLMQVLPEYEQGWLSAVMEAQMRLQGAFFLEEALTQEVTERLHKACKADAFPSRDDLLVEVSKQITRMERVVLLDLLSARHEVTLWGPRTDAALSGVSWRGSASYFEAMPRIFRASRVNLNVSMKCIASGIPLRALDILGSGGFLLSNAQPELAEVFEDGVDLALYTSLEEAAEKCAYYLRHEAEREEIARNGLQKVREAFRYEDRIRTMLETL